MPKPLPGSKDADESTTRISVSGYYFSDAELTVLQELLVTWHDICETGARPFLTPLSAYLTLPQLRAFWPLSCIDHNGNVYDLSGQARTLSYKGSGALTPAYRNYTPTIVLDSADNEYLSRSHDPALQFPGAFSFGLWFKPHAGCGDGLVMGKAGATSTISLRTSWAIALENAAAAYPRYRFYWSPDGTTLYYVSQQPSLEPVIGAWHLLVATYPADPLKPPELYFDARPVSTLPYGPSTAAVYNGTEPLVFGHAAHVAEPYLDGEIALPFVCATYLTADVVAKLYDATRTLLP